MASTCRSCSAPIRWGRVGQHGKPIPLDADPVAGPLRGQVFRRDRQDFFTRVTQEMVDRRAVSERDGPFYVTHFATCPNAAEHRKRRG